MQQNQRYQRFFLMHFFSKPSAFITHNAIMILNNLVCDSGVLFWI